MIPWNIGMTHQRPISVQNIFHFQVHRSVKILNYSILIESTSHRFCIQGSANFSPSSLQLNLDLSDCKVWDCSNQ